MTPKPSAPEAPAKKITKPSYKPNPKDRATVRTMTAYGIKAADVALCLGIGRTTLFKYYQPELTTSHIQANAEMASHLFKNGKRGNVTAQIFWLKTQGGWREVNRLEHSGAVGTYDLTKVSDEDLARLQSILGPLAPAGPADAGSDSGGTSAPGFVPSVEQNSVS